MVGKLKEDGKLIDQHYMYSVYSVYCVYSESELDWSTQLLAGCVM